MSEPEELYSRSNSNELHSVKLQLMQSCSSSNMLVSVMQEPLELTRACSQNLDGFSTHKLTFLMSYESASLTLKYTHMHVHTNKHSVPSLMSYY